MKEPLSGREELENFQPPTWLVVGVLILQRVFFFSYATLSIYKNKWRGHKHLLTAAHPLHYQHPPAMTSVNLKK